MHTERMEFGLQDQLRRFIEGEFGNQGHIITSWGKGGLGDARELFKNTQNFDQQQAMLRRFYTSKRLDMPQVTAPGTKNLGLGL